MILLERIVGLATMVYIGLMAALYDSRFLTYFSILSLYLVAAAYVLGLKSRFLNHFVITYVPTALYLLIHQGIWIVQNGLMSNLTYQTLDPPLYPWWSHVINHLLPIPLAAWVMIRRRPAVSWKIFGTQILLLAAWSYTVDAQRFLGIPVMVVAYPVGIPVAVIYLLGYQRFLLPRLERRWGSRSG